MSQYIHCKKEEEELIKAMEEWIRTVRRNSVSDELKSEAYKKFLVALKAHDDCLATWFKKRPQG